MVPPPNTPLDLMISAGRVVCTESGIDGPGYVAIRGDRIVAVEQLNEPNVDRAAANSQFDFPDGILLPGLIDLHAHPANSGSVFGVAPDDHIVPYGTTTVLSQGDAGAFTIDQYVEDTISASKTRVLLASICRESANQHHVAALQTWTTPMSTPVRWRLIDIGSSFLRSPSM